MQLEVIVSKHGTRVVTASNLYVALGLPAGQYARQVRRWLKDVYEFSDGIRQPVALQDFGKRPRPGEPVEDYYLTLELAKLAALRSSSKAKVKVARYLETMGNQMEQLSLF